MSSSIPPIEVAGTEAAPCQAAVKEGADGALSIVFEVSGHIPSLARSLIGLRLKEGTTIAEAEQTARHLNSHLAALSITTFGDLDET